MKKICKNCQHWEQGTLIIGLGGECLMAENKGGHAMNSESKAVAQDYQGYKASLETAPDFGCNQWVEKVKQEG